MRILFVLLFVIPLIELYFLIELGEVIGALPTILLTVFTGVAGIALMRSQGLATVQTAQQEMAMGQSPQGSMMEGVFIFLGGVMLFFPGLVSDSIGLLFLLPPFRRFLIGQSLKGFQTKGHYRAGQNQDIFDGEWSEKEPESPKNIDHHNDTDKR